MLQHRSKVGNYNEQVQPCRSKRKNCPVEARSDGIRYQKAIERDISSSSLNSLGLSSGWIKSFDPVKFILWKNVFTEGIWAPNRGGKRLLHS